MKDRTRLFLGLGFAITMFAIMVGIGVAEDKAAYITNEFTKTREVATQVASFEFTATTTNTVISYPHNAMKIMIKAASDIYVNPSNSIALNIDSTTGSTWAGDNKLHEAGGTNFTNLGVSVGDVVVMNEGDGNDGVYYIVAIPSATTLTLDRTTSVAHTDNQDYDIQSCEVTSTDGWRTFNVGTGAFGVKSGSGSVVVECEIYYQKGN